ncbi:universal stress protein [Halapricum hydrolyticum]|uniref:Universal stress protein n=1 Tax=Halapricum hydrolyticum TaxID=2979991 RepID=A0AAE3ICP2_9EURY|nr:universal stress protein [Halapricum hydrolyticum]MCU4718785.1 universal stress protein [Halapricum hydrolyticum]MCU4727807.1 universal stress protein [Halapricum hydrolyticum]
MTLVVPFDGSDLAEAALIRAAEFAVVFDEPILAVTVIPQGNTRYARENGWIGPDEEWDEKVVASRLHERVTRLAPGADFEPKLVDRYPTAGTISNRVRRVAKDVNASMVFVGSESAGQIVTSLSSVGSGIATDRSYDVVIVRHHDPAEVSKFESRTELSEADRSA